MTVKDASVPWWQEAGVEPIPCCDHCLCGEVGGIWPTRDGHDDTCRHCAMPSAKGES